MSLDIFVQPTPNPNALKFIVDLPVLNEGKATFKSAKDCQGVPL
ncbi:MAG: NifU N-terminal domain-containing protein, partial [Bacteriovoracaceae bacterium]|nr:NifU N-terminal domain-containing protein [Bacteriovoracaceae bacterium]